MANGVKLPVSGKVIKDILSKSLSRTFDGPVEVTKYALEKLSFYHNRKSNVYRVAMDLDFPGRVFDVPPVVVAKFYSLDGDKATRELNQAEYEIEKRIFGLSDELVCQVSSTEEKRVYPRFFSGKVSECDKYLAIVRQFVHEGSSLRIVLDKKDKRQEVYWGDVNGVISTLALLHINDSWLRERINPPTIGEGYLSDKVISQIERIAHASGREIGEDLKKGLKNRFTNLFSKYLFSDESLKVINGDLNVSPRHATNSVLLDAGRTVIGPCSDDLALYSDPIFSAVLDSKGEKMDLCARGEATVRDYMESYNNLADILQYEHLPEALSKDFLMASFWVSAMLGGIKGASASLIYGNKFLEHSRRLTADHLQNVVEDYVANIYNSMDLLREHADRGEKRILSELECLLSHASLSCPHKKLMYRKTSKRNNSSSRHNLRAPKGRFTKSHSQHSGSPREKLNK